MVNGLVQYGPGVGNTLATAQQNVPHPLNICSMAQHIMFQDKIAHGPHCGKMGAGICSTQYTVAHHMASYLMVIGPVAQGTHTFTSWWISHYNIIHGAVIHATWNTALYCMDDGLVIYGPEHINSGPWAASICDKALYHMVDGLIQYWLGLGNS